MYDWILREAPKLSGPFLSLAFAVLCGPDAVWFSSEFAPGLTLGVRSI